MHVFVFAISLQLEMLRSWSLSLLSYSLLTFALPQTSSTPDRLRRQDVDILTSYLGYDGCDSDKKKDLEQAIKDSVALAEAGIDQRHDELSTMVVPDIIFNKVVSNFYLKMLKRHHYNSRPNTDVATVYDRLFRASSAEQWGARQNLWFDICHEC